MLRGASAHSDRALGQRACCDPDGNCRSSRDSPSRDYAGSRRATRHGDAWGAGDRAQIAGRSRRSGFVPLDDPAFVPVDQAGYFNDDELVLGAEWAGEVRAYPVRMLRYHHIVNDTVAENPLLVTY